VWIEGNRGPFYRLNRARVPRAEVQPQPAATESVTSLEPRPVRQEFGALQLGATSAKRFPNTEHAQVEASR
jgi:hypothetical protein